MDVSCVWNIYLQITYLIKEGITQNCQFFQESTFKSSYIRSEKKGIKCLQVTIIKGRDETFILIERVFQR